MPSGFMYMVTIIDWYSRFVIGWSISNTMKSDFVIRAVKEAIENHGTPIIINSDQGSQFTSRDYIDCVNSYETIKMLQKNTVIKVMSTEANKGLLFLSFISF
jgi:putative transposase